jgi:large subunit ribosomal protein L6
LPAGVTATLVDGVIEIKGPKGTLTQAIYPGIVPTVEEGVVTLRCDDVALWKYWGTMRSLIANMVKGVSE